MNDYKIKVLIIDDEKLERTLIIKGFDWDKNGFLIVAEAENGKIAISILENFEVDLIITDINMPFMDGLEFIKCATNIYGKLKVVILTGFRDFEYVQKALKLGVKDFILKPINMKDLEETVLKLKDEILEEKEEKKEFQALKKIQNEKYDIIFQSFLQLLVENRSTKNNLIKNLKNYDLEFLIHKCVCINIKIHFENGISNEIKENIQGKIVSIVDKTNLQKKVCFVHYLGNVIILINEDNFQIIKAKAVDLKNEILNKINKDITIGISDVNFEFEGIEKAYIQSEIAIGSFIVTGKNLCMTFEEFEQMKWSKNSNIDINWVDLIFCVENALTSKVTKYVDEYISKIRLSRECDPDYIKIMSMNIISIATISVTKKGKNLAEIMGDENYIYDKISKIKTLDDMNILVKEILLIVVEFLKNRKSKKSNQLTEKAIKYIYENLTSPELSLKTISKSLFINESYLSRVFKQENGVSLIEFITAQRIEMSIKLLNTTDLKSYEIADKVGIVDPHYFGICFKKYVGKTINQFKNT